MLPDGIILTPPTPEQIAEARINALAATHPASWIWDETTTSWAAPTAPPADGLPYLWDETTQTWINFPDFPTA
jgi:hypothetical protein